MFSALSLVAPAFAGGKDKRDHSGVSIAHIVDDNRGNFWIRSDDLDLRAEWRGQFEFNEAGDGLRSLTDRLQIEHKKGDSIERVVFKEKDGGIDAIYTLADRPLSDRSNEAARISALTRPFILESGMNAEERVADLHRNGGTDLVFEEIAQIKGGHASRKYLAALAELTQLSTAEITRYADIVADLQGDHNIRKLMEAAASGDLTPDAIEIATTLLQRIDGDHDYRKGAEALFDNRPLPDNDTAEILYAVAKRVSGDHDKRNALIEILEQMPMEQKLLARDRDIASGIGSSHDREKALAALD